MLLHDPKLVLRSGGPPLRTARAGTVLLLAHDFIIGHTGFKVGTAQRHARKILFSPH